MTTLPDDPLFAWQWHLDRSGTPGAAIDLNVVPVWEDYTGAGVDVGVIDTPVDHLHPDLAANYFGITMTTGGLSHGTSVAGLIAAARNGIGGVGVAYDARITGLGQADQSLVMAGDAYDVANISLSARLPFESHPVWTEEFAYGADQGRGGLGTIFVVASGNARQDYFDANTSPMTMDRHTLVVGAVGRSGMVSDYSSEGATLTVVAPSGSTLTGDIVTTDLPGLEGAARGDYTETFNGTSAAAPMVSGVVALMLEANPALGWRDVQEIMAITARHTGSEIGAPLAGAERFGWSVNQAMAVNGGGYHFSNDYGFGLVDALAAVRLAETWDRQQTSLDEQSATASFAGSLAIPDQSASGVEVTFEIGSGITIERLELAVGLNHGDARQLEITLIAPSGTESILFFHRGEPPNLFGQTQPFRPWTFGSNAFAGESAEGVWRVRVADTVGGGEGVLAHLTLKVYGEADSADDLYCYTNEYGALAGVVHSGLLGDEGGIDTLNAAAVTCASRIDLRGGATSLVNGHDLVIAAGTLIEHAVGGDGDDRIAGNAAANRLRGGRGADLLVGRDGDDLLEGFRGDDRMLGGDGDDRLEGEDGQDWLAGGAGNDLLLGGAGIDAADYEGAGAGVRVDLAVAGAQDTVGAGLDTLDGIERLRGSAFADRLAGSAFANALRGGAGDDRLLGGAGDDLLHGGAGTDHLAGGTGASDTAAYDGAEAGVGVDLLIAELQDTGGAGHDRLSGIERLIGSAFADQFSGDARANRLDGRDGADRLLGRAGDDVLVGGAGNDELDGGEGRDLAVYAAAGARVTVDLAIAGLQRPGGAGIDRLSGIEDVLGSAFADRLFGDAAANRFVGGDGHDRLEGRDGDDLLAGGAGDDRLIGGAGNDFLFGGEGNDIADYGGAEEGATVSLALVTAQATGGAGRDRLLGVEAVIGSAFADLLSGDGADNRLWGGVGDDRLAGGEGADWLQGGDGDDMLSGEGGFDLASYADARAGVAVSLLLSGPQDTGAGVDSLSGIEGLVGSAFADRLIGDGAANRLIGGDGDDMLEGGARADRLAGGRGDDRLEGGAGIDLATYADAGAGVTVDLTEAMPQDTIGAGVDTLSGIEHLAGSAFADRLTGDAGANRLRGNGGDDLLIGGEGDDVLMGDDGADMLMGGLGLDQLFGGADADTFVAGATGTALTIADFEDGIDLIDLSAFGPGAFISVYSLNDHIPDDHNLYIFIDAADDGIPYQLITVTDFLERNRHGWLTAEDFLLAG